MMELLKRILVFLIKHKAAIINLFKRGDVK